MSDVPDDRPGDDPPGDSDTVSDEMPKADGAEDPEAPNGHGEVAMTVEDLLGTLEQVTAQRDEYLDSLQRLQAEFENFRRRSATESEQRIAAGVARLAESLLPVLDGCDAALAQGLEEVAPIHSSLAVSLEKEGLERIETVGVPFDPNEHEAVMHEAGDGNEQVVVEELRSGYRWKGRVLRAAMVKVRS